MKKSKVVTHILKYPIRSWAHHISGKKKSMFGSLCVTLGQPFCGLVGKLVLLGDKNVRQIT